MNPWAIFFFFLPMTVVGLFLGAHYLFGVYADPEN